MKLSVLLTALVPLFFASACAPASSDGDCTDGSDNDADGLIDSQDPGCALNGDSEAPDPVLYACNDTVDNDGDGRIDTDDYGCANSQDDDEYNEPISACQDGEDNDGDGLTDFPNDPGCVLTLLDSEADDCPNGDGCPACANEIDDDSDGLLDYPADPGCNSAGDDDEFNADPSICGTTVLIQPLPTSGELMGQFGSSAPNELISPVCGGGGEEQVFIYEVTQARALLLSTDFPETTVDTVIYVRSECRMIDTEVGCNDGDFGSTLQIDRLEPGTYYIIVDTHTTVNEGVYRLQVSEFVPEHETCDATTAVCAPGLECKQAIVNGVPALDETCEAADPGTVVGFSVPVFLRGSFNGWTTDQGWELQQLPGQAVYTRTVSLSAGQHEFKIADADWGVANIGSSAGVATVNLNAPTTLANVSGTQNLLFDAATTGQYLFSLDATDLAQPVLTVSAL
jgi:hypothetical protein